MRDTGSNPIIVRTYAPARRIVVIVAVTLLALFALYVIYELGRYDAGYCHNARCQRRCSERARGRVELEQPWRSDCKHEWPCHSGISWHCDHNCDQRGADRHGVDNCHCGSGRDSQCGSHSEFHHCG